jgi:hypothetical protein
MRTTLHLGQMYEAKLIQPLKMFEKERMMTALFLFSAASGADDHRNLIIGH